MQDDLAIHSLIPEEIIKYVHTYDNQPVMKAHLWGSVAYIELVKLKYYIQGTPTTITLATSQILVTVVGKIYIKNNLDAK